MTPDDIAALAREVARQLLPELAKLMTPPAVDDYGQRKQAAIDAYRNKRRRMA